MKHISSIYNVVKDMYLMSTYSSIHRPYIKAGDVYKLIIESDSYYISDGFNQFKVNNDVVEFNSSHVFTLKHVNDRGQLELYTFSVLNPCDSKGIHLEYEFNKHFFLKFINDEEFTHTHPYKMMVEGTLYTIKGGEDKIELLDIDTNEIAYTITAQDIYEINKSGIGFFKFFEQWKPLSGVLYKKCMPDYNDYC